MKNVWDNFKGLHLAVQMVLATGIFVLLIIIAINHMAEENLINLLLAVQSIALFSKTHTRDKPK